MQVNGWTLLFHGMASRQLASLADAVRRAQRSDPDGWRGNANAKVLASLARLMLDTIPADPGAAAFRQGNTLGEEHRNWFRAKFNQRFRLFFRYDSRSRIIVYAWVNDENTLRARGSRSDPYAVFRGMLDAGDPPERWDALLAAAADLPGEIGAVLDALAEAPKR